MSANEVIWLDVQTRVGKMHKMGGGHPTFQLRLSLQTFILVWGHQTKLHLKSMGGHHTFQLRLSGRMFKLGWGQHTKF